MSDLEGKNGYEALKQELSILALEVEKTRSDAERREKDGQCFTRKEFEHKFGGLTGWQDTSEPEKSNRPAWTIQEFLAPGLGETVASFMKPAMADAFPEIEIAFIRALGRTDSVDLVKQLLEEKGVIDALAKNIVASSTSIAHADAATGPRIERQIRSRRRWI